MINPFHPITLKKCFQTADLAPVSTNALLWLGESDYALARYRAFLKHARKPSSHDQQSPRHGVWPTCGANCAAYIAHSFPGTFHMRAMKFGYASAAAIQFVCMHEKCRHHCRIL
jgi:hypothetical protein